MTFAIYQIRLTPETDILYDISFNNLVVSLPAAVNIVNTIKKLEDIRIQDFSHLINFRHIPINSYYDTACSFTKIYEHEFTDTEDLQANLRNLISEQHPEFLI